MENHQLDCLVGGGYLGATYPSEKNMKVSWDYYSQYIYICAIYIYMCYIWKNKKCSKPPNQSKIVDLPSGKTNIANWKITMSNR